MNINIELWNKIKAFNFDSTPGEFGFSTRLARENHWTTDFTERAIEEYRKFMYLAANNSVMVSPSQIVDEVWHLHLLFTQSYNDFCKLIGKQIQHIPSTHDPNEKTKFLEAKEQTKKLYEQSFGKQDKMIWEKPTMFDGLDLKISKISIHKLHGLIGIIILIALIPGCFLFYQLAFLVNGPKFLIFYLSLGALIYAGLSIWNGKKFFTIWEGFDKDSFLHRLNPNELVYLKKQKISDVINVYLDELIRNGNLSVASQNRLQIKHLNEIKSEYTNQLLVAISEQRPRRYFELIPRLKRILLFENMEKCFNDIQERFMKTKAFLKIYFVNALLTSFFLLAGVLRMIFGISFGKPILYLFALMLALIGYTVFHFRNFASKFISQVLVLVYKKTIDPKQCDLNLGLCMFFLNGKSELSVEARSYFIDYNTFHNNHNDGGSGCGSSGCGSSGCGSGCGGCGGCGG